MVKIFQRGNAVMGMNIADRNAKGNGGNPPVVKRDDAAVVPAPGPDGFLEFDFVFLGCFNGKPHKPWV